MKFFHRFILRYPPFIKYLGKFQTPCLFPTPPRLLEPLEYEFWQNFIFVFTDLHPVQNKK